MVDRLRINRHTRDLVLRVDVKHHVVILDGEVPSTLAKRAAGDDTWDTPGVADVSNLLTVAAGPTIVGQVAGRVEPLDLTVVEAPTVHPGLRVRDVMTSDPRTVPASSTVGTAARIMRDADIGAVIVEEEDGTIAGVLTDRDILVRGVAEEGDLGAMPIADEKSPGW